MNRVPRAALRAARNLLHGGAPAATEQPAEVVSAAAPILGALLYQPVKKSYSRATEGER